MGAPVGLAAIPVAGDGNSRRDENSGAIPVSAPALP